MQSRRCGTVERSTKTGTGPPLESGDRAHNSRSIRAVDTATRESRRRTILREQESRIVDAAAAEFRRAGVKQADIERIARDAGVSRATVYRRFANRDELLAEVIARVRRRLLGKVADRV
ncbi:MAG: TetR/AcrR family transcriptional regulator [Gordonia sp. (in: high G+C Gram-positive bacteria)]|nr:MAG: TetR/AcrR family transcriptional regulator [Gordonia sp. (in: high G+C Gram-positive bacteria)]